MTYDIHGLGISELVFVAVNYPVTYQALEKVIETDIDEGLRLARKVIEVHDNDMIERQGG